MESIDEVQKEYEQVLDVIFYLEQKEKETGERIPIEEMRKWYSKLSLLSDKISLLKKENGGLNL